MHVTAAPGAAMAHRHRDRSDKNTLSIRWWQYAGADTYPGTIAFAAPGSLKTTFQLPPDAASGQTIHALIQVTDNGAPPLTSFQRVIVTVKAP